MSRDKDNKMDVYTGGRLTKGVIETIAPHLKDTTLDGRFNTKANATSLAAKLDKAEAADLYPTKADVSATYVTFKNFDGSPVVGKHVEITLTADGTDIDNIRVVTP